MQEAQLTNRPLRSLAVGAARFSMVALMLLTASCGDGSSGSAPPVVSPTPAPTPTPTPTPTATPRPAQTEREIAPATANPALAASDAANFTINPDPAVAPRGRLFVMLPGTGAIPRNYRTIVRTGASRGWHGIGLTYPNAEAVGDLCGGTTDPDCTGNTRREIITGESLSALVAVNAANSITGRLTALLTYLDRTFPTEGWGQFLRNGAVDWSLVTVAGHSQGAGHAAYMAKLFSLDRAVMFSGAGDVGVPGSPIARWFSLPNITPASRQYGFTHTADELVTFALLRSNWNAIGLPAPAGGPVSVDGANPPYGSSNQLSTSADPTAVPPAISTSPRHASPVADVITPSTAQGTPLYAPVWTYLAFP